MKRHRDLFVFFIFLAFVIAVYINFQSPLLDYWADKKKQDENGLFFLKGLWIELQHWWVTNLR